MTKGIAHQIAKETNDHIEIDQLAYASPLFKECYCTHLGLGYIFTDGTSMELNISDEEDNGVYFVESIEIDYDPINDASLPPESGDDGYIEIEETDETFIDD